MCNHYIEIQWGEAMTRADNQCTSSRYEFGSASELDLFMKGVNIGIEHFSDEIDGDEVVDLLDTSEATAPELAAALNGYNEADGWSDYLVVRSSNPDFVE